MYLLDSNIFLERLLGRGKSKDVRNLLNKVDLNEIAISDFSLHSIGIVLVKRGKGNVYPLFVQDIVIDGEVNVVSLPATKVARLVEVIDLLKLDFDDAYQYVVAEHHKMKIVSFDTDFDHTPLKRITPADILKTL